MMTTRKDMTRREFDAACSRRGFIPTGVLGYYRITDNVSVSVFNCGVNATYREILKYLIAQHKKAESES